MPAKAGTQGQRPGHRPGSPLARGRRAGDIAFRQMLEMMNAITDQGEGGVLKPHVAAAALQAVKESYRPSLVAVESDYPNFTDTGTLTKSADAPARFDNDNRDHANRG